MSRVRTGRVVRVVLSAVVTAAAATPQRAFALQALSPDSGRDSAGAAIFRNIGPPVAGGRVSQVVGIAGNPDTCYVGAAAGGVWKTVDGGMTWKDVFARQPVASIGAIALAPSNPNLVWVGTGEANIRNDVITGHGIYLSGDAGASWRFMGLADAGQISRMIVDPHNPDRVFVAVLGNAWKPTAHRARHCAQQPHARLRAHRSENGSAVGVARSGRALERCERQSRARRATVLLLARQRGTG